MDAPARPRRARRRLAALALAVLAAGGLVACSDDGTDAEDATGDAGNGAEAQADEDGEGFVEGVEGDQVEATGAVTRVLSEHAFLLLDTLVITSEALDVGEGETVRVAGQVRELDVAELEDDLGVDLDDAELEEVGRGMVVVADEVERPDGG